MKLKHLLFLLPILILSCVQQQDIQAPEKPLNEVLVLGAIHSGHKTDSVYNTVYLDKLIREIKPDYILAEIPPDRMQEAMEGFKRDDSISEPRVMRFPEYVDVVFPLSKELDFEIIPNERKSARHEQINKYFKQAYG